jgi:hypothetical protein
MDFVNKEPGGESILPAFQVRGGVHMKIYQYRCNRCMILEERLLSGGQGPLCTVPCPKCGGLAIRLPTSASMEKIFEEVENTPVDRISCEYS